MRPTCTPTFSHLDKKLVNIDYRSRDTYARKLSLSEFHDCLIFECSRWKPPPTGIHFEVNCVGLRHAIVQMNQCYKSNLEI